jgi:hypothetical protein
MKPRHELQGVGESAIPKRQHYQMPEQELEASLLNNFHAGVFGSVRLQVLVQAFDVLEWQIHPHLGARGVASWN